MAGTTNDMAKSTVRVLHADAATVGRPSGTGRHHHSFWQLDHCALGAFTVTVPQGAVRLGRGLGILLPPGTPHDFRYPVGSRYVSWKFNWTGPGLGQAVVLDRQPGWRGLAASLADRPASGAIAHLLAGAMHLAGASTEAPPLAGFVGRITEQLDAHPERIWSVASLARALDLSPGHLSASFRAEQGMALKRWLDVHRAEQAGRVLAASDLAIGDVAARCGFADPFAFSRYFRRVTGQSPSAFRLRAGAAFSRRPGD